MRWTGLAIKDSVMLERTRLSEVGNLFFYRAKAEMHTLLQSLPNSNPHYSSGAAMKIRRRRNAAGYVLSPSYSKMSL
jgi:hypothetical protein